MPSPFDIALVNHAVYGAAIDYARQVAPPGTPEYQAAWLEFRRSVRTPEDLARWRREHRDTATRPAATAARARRPLTRVP